MRMDGSCKGIPIEWERWKMKKLMDLKRIHVTFVAFFAALWILTAVAHAANPKYVFFFLGDGMANSQIQATEAFLTQRNGGQAWVAEDLLRPENRLKLTQMPVQGMQTTYDAYALMTDSASSATAFASGIKTRSAVINMDSAMAPSTSYKSIAQLAHERGRKVGVVTSVSLNHATPAAYYASVPHRGQTNSIATQLAESGFEFFGGGGIVRPTSAGRSGDTENDVWALLAANGYTVLNDRESILALRSPSMKQKPGRPTPMSKVVAINPVLDGSQAMPYAIDKPAENLSLAEMTEVAIAHLYDRRGGKGFFLMVEGGKIDWACHANDAMATIGDMLDFDDAVGVALEFYKRHPNDTLIVVTGDHETGGMTVGHALTAYTAHYDKLLGQQNSHQHFAANGWRTHRETYGCGETLPENVAMLDLIYEAFGLNWDDLNDYQKERLQDAYEMSLCGSNSNSAAKNRYLYGGYEPIIVTLTHILNESASIGWTSYAHTGVPVPVYAQGRQASLFSGFYDNTDIAKKLAQAMNIREILPVQK